MIPRTLSLSLLLFFVIAIIASPGLARPPGASDGQDRLQEMVRDGWVTVAPGVLQRSRGNHKVETVALGPEGFTWRLGQLQAQLGSLLNEYRIRPTADLRKAIRNQRQQIRETWEYIQVLKSMEADVAAVTTCNDSYMTRADAYPTTSPLGMRADAEASFSNDCGYSCDTYAYSYATATLNGTTTTLTQTDRDTGSNSNSYTTASVAGTSSCYSYAYASVTCADLGVSYSAADQSFACLVFDDVPLDHWARREIEAIYFQGITKGCAANPLRYCPAFLLTRSEVAIFLLRAKLGGDYLPPAVDCNNPLFTDVPCTHWAAAWIEDLARRGITTGCGIPGSYCPEAVVERWMMAVFLLRTLEGGGYVPPAVDCNNPRFADVPCTYFAATWIEELARRQITNGCGIPGNFCPADMVDRSQAAIFLARAFQIPLP